MFEISNELNNLYKNESLYCLGNVIYKIYYSCVNEDCYVPFNPNDPNTNNNKLKIFKSLINENISKHECVLDDIKPGKSGIYKIIITYSFEKYNYTLGAVNDFKFEFKNYGNGNDKYNFLNQI